MFEDSTFESNGRIRTRSRRWMLAALALNSSIVLALILIPLVYPEALPWHGISILVEVPPPPAAQTPPPQHQSARTAPAHPEMNVDSFTAPRLIPNTIVMLRDPAPAGVSIASTWDPGNGVGVPGGDPNVFGSQPAPRVVHPDAPKTVSVPSTIAAGLLLRKVVPQYPQLAKAMRKEGTVVLAATIAKNGTIVNLRVVSGPAVLAQAAMDAVSQWIYRPYLLNGQPVEVETQVNVVFTLGG
jgi:protein TonB